nr:MAG TPA: hypothetical protein [Caudoviricetes sp.]
MKSMLYFIVSTCLIRFFFVVQYAWLVGWGSNGKAPLAVWLKGFCCDVMRVLLNITLILYICILMLAAYRSMRFVYAANIAQMRHISQIE